MEEYTSALIAFKQVVDLYYDSEYNELAHMKTIACYIYRNEFEEAQKYYDEKRSFIEKINMDDLVDEWFIQKRVLDRLELE